MAMKKRQKTRSLTLW
ncbi:hypothetical protein RDI58_013051 [Solanum bulbocastanum]|uniref:Uncharacterized protein n=1 Tax=Solanum bulbocastanum TaxID=147425 RepID=A0AAN8YE91_SOLBU